MTPVVPQIAVPRGQIETELNVFRAKVELQKAMLNAHIQRNVKERALMTSVVGALHFMLEKQFSKPWPVQPDLLASLREWQTAHQAHGKAQEDLLRVTLAELESQVTLRETVLREADQKVKIPKGHFS